MRKEVMCEMGAVPRARVCLCRKAGRRRFRRSTRDCEVTVVEVEFGRVMRCGRVCGRVARRRVVRNILKECW
jgi:hypothetical protein